MGVRAITISAVLCITSFAQFEIITVPDTFNTPDFPLAATVATSSVGDAVQANTLVTLSALFRILALHTEPFLTAIAVPLSTTMQTVTPVAGPAHFTHEINLPLIPFFNTIMTVVFHAIIASHTLCSIFNGLHLHHFTFFEVITTVQACIYSVAQKVIVPN